MNNNTWSSLVVPGGSYKTISSLHQIWTDLCNSDLQ